MPSPGFYTSTHTHTTTTTNHSGGFPQAFPFAGLARPSRAPSPSWRHATRCADNQFVTGAVGAMASQHFNAMTSQVPRAQDRTPHAPMLAETGLWCGAGGRLRQRGPAAVLLQGGHGLRAPTARAASLPLPPCGAGPGVGPGVCSLSSRCRPTKRGLARRLSVGPSMCR
jgi:hypothetical protein